MNPNHFIKCSNLKIGHPKGFKSHPLTFTIPKDSLAVLLGPNGAGKSTLIKTLLGELAVLEGEFEMVQSNQKFSQLTLEQLKNLVAFVPQEHIFPAELALVDFLKLAFLPKTGPFEPLPSSQSPEIQTALEQFGLSLLAGCRLRELSMGERQRAFLAHAILQKPKILILDEPTNHLDPGGVEEFWDYLIGIKSVCEVLVSTHDLEFAQKQADWVLALNKGEVFFNDTSTHFFERELQKKLYGLK